ncbi:MAG: hypothetical protein NXI30_12280 [bacterium]|nr:hypothetical protein [bacterium]
MPPLDACSHRPPCPGCARFGEPGPAPDAVAAVARLCERHGLPAPPVHTTSGVGHRHRARLAVRGRARSPKIGLFQADSHRIVDTPRCAVHHPAINAAAAHLKQAIRATGIAPYADTPHRGALRYAQFVVERATERVQVVLVGNGTTPDVLGPLPEAFAEAMGPSLQGLFFNAQADRTNVIFGRDTIHLAGEPVVRERIGGVDVFFPPTAFGQNHLPLFDRAVERIHALVPDGATVFEAYCGVGAIGLGLLERGPVRFNERSPSGLAGLELGLAARPEPERARAERLEGAAGDRIEGLADAEVVIVDPPRKGLDPALLSALVANPPKRLVYLACGLPRLLEELPMLIDEGGMRLAGAEIFDFFPFTSHVETLVWLDRNGEHSSAAANADEPEQPA